MFQNVRARHALRAWSLGQTWPSSMLCLTVGWSAHSTWLRCKTCRVGRAYNIIYKHPTLEHSKVRHDHTQLTWLHRMIGVGPNVTPPLACYASQSNGLHTLHDRDVKTTFRPIAHISIWHGTFQSQTWHAIEYGFNAWSVGPKWKHPKEPL